MKKISLIIISIVLISLFMVGCQSYEMNFTQMRNPTNEENYNNGYCYAEMAADENYICFVDEEGDLISYEINKNEYTVLDNRYEMPNFNHDFLGLQIYDGELYYKKTPPVVGHNEIVRVNLSSEERTVMTRKNAKNTWGVFNVYDGKVVAVSEGQDLILSDGVEEEVIYEGSVDFGFAISGDSLYFEEYGKLYKLNLQTKEIVDLNIMLDESTRFNSMFVHKGDIYVMTESNDLPIQTLLGVVRDDEFIQLDSGLTYYPYENDAGMVFYNDYIVCVSGIYDLDGNYIAEIANVREEVRDGKVYYMGEPSIQILVVGGNLYVYDGSGVLDGKNDIDFEYVGTGWYYLSEENFYELVR